MKLFFLLLWLFFSMLPFGQGVQSVWIRNATFQPNATNSTVVPFDSFNYFTTLSSSTGLLIWFVNMVFCFCWLIRKRGEFGSRSFQPKLVVCNMFVGVFGAVYLFITLIIDITMFCGPNFNIEHLCEGLIFSSTCSVVSLLGSILIIWMIAIFKEFLRSLRPAKYSWIDDYKAICNNRSGSLIGINLTRCLFIGPPGAGKSSLKHLLLNKQSKGVEESTPVLEKPEIVQELYNPGSSGIEWKRVNNNLRKDFVRQKTTEIRSALQDKRHRGCCDPCRRRPKRQTCRYSMNSLNSEEDIENEWHRHGSRSANARSRSRFYRRGLQFCCHCYLQTSNRGWEKLTEALEDLLQEIDSKETTSSFSLEYNENVVGTNVRFIHFLDTGGQPVFHDILPMFIGTPCLYMYVFNSTFGLCTPFNLTYRPKNEQQNVIESTNTVGDLMLQTFSSINTMEQKVSVDFRKLLKNAKLSKDLPQSSVVPIATFKDKLLTGNGTKKETDLRESWRSFKETVAIKPYERLFGAEDDLFLVNNLMTCSDQSQMEDDTATLENLRNTVSTSRAAFDIQIPLLWLLIDLVTQKAGIKFVEYSTLYEFCRHEKFVSDAQEFRTLVAFMHTLGFFAYFKVDECSKDSLICTDAAFLYREVSKLLVVQFKQSIKHESTRRLKTIGVIDANYPEMFHELGIAENAAMDHQWFLKLLVHIGIAAGMDENCYFVPIALPECPATPSALMEEWEGTVDTLCFTVCLKQDVPLQFADAHILPQGIYCQLCTYIIREAKWKVLASKSCRTRITYRMDTRATIILAETPTHIEVSVYVHCGLGEVGGIHNMEEIHSVCIEVQGHVRRGIKAAYESVFSQSPNDVSIALGFACPCRRASKDGHLMIMDETYKDNAGCFHKITPLNARQILWFKIPCEAMNASALGKIVEEESIYYVNPTLDSRDTPSRKGSEDGHGPESNLCEIHINHLVQFEAEMRTKLSLEGLIPLLERPAGGFMTPDERIAVTNTSTDPEKVSKIISILRKKTDGDYVKFCNILDKSGNQHWTASLRGLHKVYDARLVEVEADMRTKLSLEGLIPLLEQPAGGFMTQEERVLVTSASTDPEKVSKIISILRKKTNEDFVRFCSILEKSGNGHWATYLRHVDSEVKFLGPHTKQSLIPPAGHSDHESGQNETPLQATPTLYILDTHVIQHIALDWNKIAENLEIDISILKAIEASYDNDAKCCCREMFSRWLAHVPGTGDSSRTWKSVLIALRTAGYTTLVGDMERQLSIS